ncbi:MAG: hypothetical protein ABL920_10005, partial [Methylotenera sp.]
MAMQYSPKPLLKLRQKGAALIFMAFILGLGAAVYVLKTYNSDIAKAKRDEKTYQALKEAKVVLMAWAVANQYNPGQMPWPDRNGDGNYDGSSDCVTTSFQYSYLLGQLPSQPTTSPCLNPNNGLTVYTGFSTYPGLGQEFTDAQGNRLWYAVSRNLVRDYMSSEDAIINPGMINAPHGITPYQRQSGTQSYPWLTVLDRKGDLVSDRVAAVVIAPDSPMENQDRSSVAPNASEFLDGFKIGAANYKNSDSALVNEDFIMGENSRNVPSSDTTFVKPYNFNDKLVYITIDELMVALEKRVGEQVRNSLKTYKVANGYYPYAAKLGATVMYSGETNLESGFLPVNPQSCQYSYTYSPISILSTKVSGNNNLTTTASFSAIFRDWVVTGAGIPADTKVTSVINLTELALSKAATGSGLSSLTFSPPTLRCNQPLFDASTSAITEIRYYLPSGTFTNSVGCSIQSSGTRCYCTGAGYCSNATNTFSCNSTSCNAVGAGATGELRVRGGKLTSTSGGCSITTPITKDASECPVNTTSRIACKTTNGLLASHANGDAQLDDYLPSWFNRNKWGEYVYYKMTRPEDINGLDVGNKTSGAIIATVGKPINSAPYSSSKAGVAQTRPSCNALNNYLDTLENSDGNTPF